MNRTVLLERIRKETLTLLNGYLDVEELNCQEGMERVICMGSWERVGSGLVGAFALAVDCLDGDACNAVNLDNASKKRSEKSQFGTGLVAGIGLSLACMVVSKLIRRP